MKDLGRRVNLNVNHDTELSFSNITQKPPTELSDSILSNTIGHSNNAQNISILKRCVEDNTNLDKNNRIPDETPNKFLPYHIRLQRYYEKRNEIFPENKTSKKELDARVRYSKRKHNARYWLQLYCPDHPINLRLWKFP